MRGYSRGISAAIRSSRSTCTRPAACPWSTNRLARRAIDVHGVADSSALDATRDQVIRRDAQDSTVADFTEAAPGVAVIDSSDMSVEETVDAVLALLPQSMR